MADEVLNVKITTDKAAADQTRQTLEGHDQLLKKLLEDYKAAEGGARNFAATQQRQSQQAVENAQTFNQGVQETAASVKDLKDTVVAVQLHLQGLKQTGEALSHLGFGEVGQMLSRAGDLQQVYRQLTSVTKELPQIGQASAALAPLLGETAAGFAATAIGAAAVAAPLIAVTLAIRAYTDAVAAQQKMVDDTVNALKSQTDAQLAVIDAIHNSTAEQIQSIIEVDKAKKAELEAELASRQAFLADIQQQYADLGSAFDPAQRAALGLAGQAAQQAIDDLTTRIAAFDTEIKTNTETILPAVQAREKETDALNRGKEAAETLNRAELKLLADREKAAAELERVTAQLTSENEKYAQMLEERRRADEQAAQIDALQQQIDNARAEEEAQQHRDKLKQIRQSEAQLDVDAAQKQAEGRQKILDSYMQNELKALANYIQAENRATEDHNRDRVRKLEDLYTSLTNLAGQRDVAAFVNTRAAGMTDIQRGDEDFGVGAQRRKEDYEKQAQEAQAARDQQLAQLQSSLQRETDQKRAALQKQEQDELSAQQTRATKSLELQKQLAALQNKFSADNLAERRRQEDAAHNAAVATLMARQQQLSAIIGGTTAPVVSFFGQVGTAIAGMFAQVHAAVVNASSSHGGGQIKPSYAAGIDVVPRDMIAMLHQGERVTRAVDNRRGGSEPPVVVNFYNTIGELVTPSQLDRVMEAQTHEIAKGLRLAMGAT